MPPVPSVRRSSACLLLSLSGATLTLACENPGERFRQVLDNARAEAAPSLAKLGNHPRGQPFQAPPAAVGPAARLTVENQGRCTKEEATTLAPGQTPLSIQIELQALTDFGIAANRYYATLVDRDDRKYPAVLGGCEPLFEAPPLAKGETAKGWLNFVVPASVRNFQLTYAPRLVDGTYADGLSVPIKN